MEWDVRICGRARGSKALVPLASLSRALLKRSCSHIVVTLVLRTLELWILAGESDIAFHVR